MSAIHALDPPAESETVMATITCTSCEAPLEHIEGVAWVDARSGNDGGTYDICLARYDETTDTQHGHTPPRPPSS